VKLKTILTIAISLVFFACSGVDHKVTVSPANSELAISANKTADRDRAAKEKQKSEEFLKFKAYWDTTVRRSFKEESLEKLPKTVIESYRFIWIPSFHNAIAVRAWRTENRHFLVAKRLDTKGSEVGRVSFENTRSLTEAQWHRVINLLEQTSFWNLPTVDIEDEPSEDSNYYVFEGNKDNRFHEVHRTNKIDEIRRLGAYMIELSELKTNYKDY
jgi:hypothetical protein